MTKYTMKRFLIAGGISLMIFCALLVLGLSLVHGRQVKFGQEDYVLTCLMLSGLLCALAGISLHLLEKAPIFRAVLLSVLGGVLYLFLPMLVVEVAEGSWAWVFVLVVVLLMVTLACVHELVSDNDRDKKAAPFMALFLGQQAVIVATGIFAMYLW